MKKFTKSFLIFLALMAFTQGTWAQTTEYITDVMVIGHKKSGNINSLKTQYTNQGWTVINKDLNQGAGGAYIYLLYKKGTNPENAITDFYLRLSDNNDSPNVFFYNGRAYYRTPFDGSNGFKNAKGDLNNEVRPTLLPRSARRRIDFPL